MEVVKMCIENEQIKEYYGSYLIYPKRFMNSMVMNKVLTELKNNGYKFYRIMDVIKAIKE